jgi:uncharacterized protein YbjT (DUF2867 family)
MKTALLFGGTGMTGSCLLQVLLNDAEYGVVKVFVRKPLTLQHAKLKQIITDFHSLEAVKEEIRGDVLFCCLGTTIRQTPSQEGRRFVEYEIPVQLAALAEANGIESFVLVSSVGANPKASNFYLRTKGEMEQAVSKFKINQIVLMQPGFLVGNRTEYRPAEKILSSMMKGISLFFVGSLSKYRPITGLEVAQAMCSIAGTSQGIRIVHYAEMKK